MNRQVESVAADGLGYRMLRIANDRFGSAPGELTPQQEKQARDIALKEILLEQAVLSSPEASEVAVPQSQIKKAYSQIRERYDSEDDFLTSLDNNGLNEGALESAVGRELLVDAVLTYVGSKVPTVDDTEVNLFYYMHPEKFERQELRTARHILVTVNPDFAENTRENAEKRVAEIQARVSKDRRRFEEQALKHSECPTSFQGGLLGEVKKGTLFPELEAELFSMKEGEVSGVVESSLGFHILLCEKVQNPHKVPLSEIKEKLRESLTERKRNKYQRNWLKEQTEKNQQSLVTETEVETISNE